MELRQPLMRDGAQPAYLSNVTMEVVVDLGLQFLIGYLEGQQPSIEMLAENLPNLMDGIILQRCHSWKCRP